MSKKKKTVRFQEQVKNNINLEGIKKTSRNLQHAIHKKKTESISEIRRRVLTRKLANMVASNKRKTHMNGNKPPGTSLNDPHISKVMSLVKKDVGRPFKSKITRKNGSFSQQFENGFVQIREHDDEREHSNQVPIKKKPETEEVTRNGFFFIPKPRKNPSKAEIEQIEEFKKFSKQHMELHKPGLFRTRRVRANEPEYPNPFVKLSGLYPSIQIPSKKYTT